METEPTAILAGVLVFIGIVSQRIFSQWMKSNSMAIRHDMEKEYGKTIGDLTLELEKAKTAVHNWSAKYRRAQRQWDWDESEDLPEDYDLSEDMNLSDLARVVYPKLPGPVAKIIDQPALQNALVGTLEKHPNLISDLVDKFTNSTNSNNTNTTKSTQAYG